MKPSERIKDIMNKIAWENVDRTREDIKQRGLIGLSVTRNPHDPALTIPAILRYLDEEAERESEPTSRD